MMQMCSTQHWVFMEQHHSQNEGILQHLDRQAEPDRLFEERMLEAMCIEAKEERRVMSKAFWDNLQLMREAVSAIYALGPMVNEQGPSTAPATAS